MDLFKKVKVDHKKIDVIRYESSSRLTASRSAIYLSEDRLSHEDRKEIESSLLHELQHIAYADDEFILFFRKIL